MPYSRIVKALQFLIPLLFLAGIIISLYIAFQDHTTPSPPFARNEYEAGYLRYAAFGDSWASGVNYGPPSEDLEWDFPDASEICRCRRVREAWPAQLSDDRNITWFGNRTLELDYQACHGSVFDGITDQINRLNQTYPPRFATLMIGGNNGGFPDIVLNCIYQVDKDHDYGPQYPDPKSECTKALSRAHQNIRAPWFRDGLLQSISAVMNEPRIAADPHFRLYVLGYAALFNHDDEARDDWSFTFWPGKEQKLTRTLRRDINAVIDEGRDLYDYYINTLLRNPQVKFVDSNFLFGGHRFCEPTDQKTLEAQNEKSWLYSMHWPDCIPLVEEVVKVQDVDAETWPSFCRKCGDLGQLGEFQRMFHPKREGHAAIELLLKGLLSSEGWIVRISEG